MNIVVFGAGAIGSLFGGLLLKNNTVCLIGRPAHVKAIRKRGLTITGNTDLHVNVKAVESVDDVSFVPDLLLLTVKSFDTRKAMETASQLIQKNTTVLSLQNGLGNIETISEVVSAEQIIAGITTHGSFVQRPGIICHTGFGKTCIGELDGNRSDRLKKIVSLFNEAGILVSISSNIQKDIFGKAIINASINPLTSIFQCKNGYLLKNPVLTRLVELVCIESTTIAKSNGFDFETDEMIDQTFDVITRTAGNVSSMLQSIRKHTRTEIDSINGKLISFAEKTGCDCFFNRILTDLIHSWYEK